jgi:hypothetical protein
MSKFPKIALAAALLVAPASALMAKDSGSPPKVNIQKTCHENIAALTLMMGNDIRANLDVCLADEQAALDELSKGWANFPSLAKSRCVQPSGYLPSYVEWLICLQMTSDVIKMRAEAPASSASANEGAGRQCPIVTIGKDGSVSSVHAC